MARSVSKAARDSTSLAPAGGRHRKSARARDREGAQTDHTGKARRAAHSDDGAQLASLQSSSTTNGAAPALAGSAPIGDNAQLAVAGVAASMLQPAAASASASADPAASDPAPAPSSAAGSVPSGGQDPTQAATLLVAADTSSPASDATQTAPTGSDGTVVQPAIYFKSVLTQSPSRPAEVTSVTEPNPSAPQTEATPAPEITPQSVLESRSTPTAPTSRTTVSSLALQPQALAEAPTLNKIALENQKQGTPQSVWALKGDGDQNIQGFATDISTNVGGKVDFKIATDSTHYRIEIYRLGYYGGDGARLVDTIDQNLSSAQIQPHPVVDYSLGLIDCGNWSVSASWQIPTDATSGVYFAKLVREDGTSGENIIPFVVRDDASTSNIVFQTSDTTWEAYNAWGGASLYWGDVPISPDDMIAYRPPNCGCGLTAIGRAYAVSYNRPFITSSSPTGGPWDFVFGAEMPAIQWLEQNGYDVSYISGVDTSRAGSTLLNHDAFLSVGHDEYWSAEQRTAVETARDNGVNLAFWSGNECYWKVRWESSIDGNGTPYRTMVCYKETWANANIDPTNINTGTWRDPRFSDPGQEPENALTGTMFQVDSFRYDQITVPYDMSQFRFWRDTDIANLQPGETGALQKNLLGYEWDSDVDNGFRPDGLVDLSLSSISVDTYLYDYGSKVGPKDNAQHSLTMYRAASGAIVFGAGTVYWSWGLSSNHADVATPTDPNVQQAMVNMFADMGIQPTTLQASLVLATQTTDHQAPVSTITSPTTGATLVEGQKVTITGTAQDFGGGKVAGVEVSTDGGHTWHKATGRETWSYSWTALANVTYDIQSRAVDDSLNLQATPTKTAVTVNLPSDTESLWTLTDKPAVLIGDDYNAVELGVRFQSTAAGDVTAIRFYKGFYNTGAHFVDLWTASGQLLATAQSVNETDEGWQTVTFSSPVHITAGTSYVASYHSNGLYSLDHGYFADAYANGQLSVAANGGVFAYSTSRAFPNSSYQGENYWVDVVVKTTANLAPTAVNDSGYATTAGTPLVLAYTTLTANDTDPDGDVLTVSAVGNASHGTVGLDAQSKTVVFTPTAGYTGAASYTYTVSDGRGGTSTATVSFNVNAASSGGASIFTPGEQPAGPVLNDGSALELGVKFTASSAGTISGIRFYKLTGETGTHTASLWSASGTLLATATFANETASGWQTATFSGPVTIAKGTTYVASYHSTGAYAATANYFTTAHTNGALTGLASASSGGNGVYAYGSGSVFPTGSYQASNYWVDVVYNASTTNQPPVAVDDPGYAVTQNTAATIAASALLANDNDPDGDTLTITSVTNGAHGTASYNSQTNVITFTPATGYTGLDSFNYTISDGHGNTASAKVTLNVTAPSTATGFFTADAAPVAPAQTDADAVELGVKFVASANGTITGLRYYKSAQDTGTHTASLWTTSGTRLATATFTNETSSGWQTVTFASPVTITAGTTYVASYHSNGHYYADSNYYSTAHTAGQLTAPASGSSGGNGVYAYGSSSLFPSASYQASNYWVDVLYNKTTGNTAPVANNDQGGTVSMNTAKTIAASTLLANDTDIDGDALAVTAVSGATHGTVALDTQTNVITFTPTQGYTGSAAFTYTIADGHGGTASAQVALDVQDTTNPPPTPAQSVFSSSATPSRTVSDSSVELGMKFQSDVAGTITGFRFYKAAGETGTHTASLWTASGALVASATYSGETASGWQTVNLATPVSISANTTYVASYHANSNYAVTNSFFGASTTSGDLTALSSALSGGNGVYAYGSNSLFPTSSYNDSNYYADVLFKPLAAA